MRVFSIEQSWKWYQVLILQTQNLRASQEKNPYIRINTRELIKFLV